MLKTQRYFLIIYGLLWQINLVFMDLFYVDVNDILNEKLMPVTLFLQQNPDDIPDQDEINNSSNSFSVNVEGNFDQAFSTMGFHRKKMNEYFCTSFLASQILSELGPDIPHLSRRMGTASQEKVKKQSNNYTSHKPETNLPRDAFLYDQGSTGYKNWLTKIATFNDIQNQIKENQKGDKKIKKNSKASNNRRNGFGANDYDDDYYEEGDVTGYAVQKPLPEDFPEIYGDTNMENNDEVLPQRSTKVHQKLAHYVLHGLTGAGGGAHHPQLEQQHHTNHYYQPNYEVHEGSHAGANSEVYFPPEHETYDDAHAHYGGYPSYPIQKEPEESKELGMKDFIDIALTTLAFLSFGMFILQVLMCITMNKQDNSLMMMPMEMPAGNEEVTEEIRRKRSLNIDDDDNGGIDLNRIRKVNEITRRVLLSINSVIQTRMDEGNCVRRIICENNNYARQQKDGQKIWIPFWNLGISWASSRFVEPKSKTSSSAILDGLKSGVIGLAGGDCERIYDNCHFQYILNEKLTMETRENKDFKFEWDI